MKYIILVSIIFYSATATFLFSNLPGTSPSKNARNWLISAPISSSHKKLVDSFTSYPVIGTIPNSDGTHTAQQFIKSRVSAAAVPPKVQPIIKHGQFSVLRGKKEDFKNYPQGNILFPDYPTLATKFDKLINFIITNPKFKAFFNKVHLNVLNELYEYLMNIYTNFNVQHVGIQEKQNGQGNTTLIFNIPLFLQNEIDYDANKKTLIINHLINIIESQMNGKIKSIMPKIPHIFATAAGKTLIQNDYSIDLTQFIIKQIDPGMQKYKQMYLEGLATYLSFFQEFTSYLLQPHPKKAQHFTAFVHIAETINEFLYDSATADKENTDPEKQIKSVLKKMNPPLFTFNYDDIRALKLLPRLAKSLSTNSKPIGWPSHIVNFAEQETFVSNHPVAYFKDDVGNIVKKAQAKRLYMVLQSGANFFQEELLAQPEWLNNWEGIVKILRACFGDFSGLVGLQILDQCMEALVQNTIDTMQGKDTSSDSFVTPCQNLLNDLKKLTIARITPPTSAPSSTTVATTLQNQLISQQQPAQDNTGPSVNDIPGLNLSSDNISPSDNDLSPSVDDLTPSDNDMGPSVDDLTLSNNDMSPSDSDISNSLNQ